MPTTKTLIDTNVFIYAFDHTVTLHSKAASFLQQTTSDLFTTSKNISDYFAVCSKQNFEREVVWNFYNDIIKNTTILYPTAESLLLFESLVKMHNPSGNRVYDFEVISIMLAHSVNSVATFNRKDFEIVKEISLLQL